MLDVKASEDQIKGHAVWSAGRVRDLLRRIGQGQATTTDQLAARLDQLAQAMQAKPVDKAITLSGRIARMVDAAWWKRNVRRQVLRENETLEHAQAAIHRTRQCYVSDHASRVKRERVKANTAMLKNLEVVNEQGEVFNLGDVADGSISNPAIRRGELMLRARGFGEVADHLGYVARFLTITCPSRFHRFTGPIDQQQENPKWDGSTPKDAQRYLSSVWAKIRAAWARAGLCPYGFRVAEPHHDGCPHWHILLWMPADQAGWFSPMKFLAGRKDCGPGVVGIAGRYAMQDSPSEIGYRNRGARFTVEKIDPERGSAVAYIVKYIGKNIDGLRQDGEGIGEDLEAEKPATEASRRVRDWASTWGIRQFQQIGGPSVTVWRELRRVREESTGPMQLEFDFEQPRKAADTSNWPWFWMLMGGPSVQRKDHTLRLWKTDTDAGKYGDVVERIRGVQSCNGALFMTRRHEWTVQRAGLDSVNQADHEQRVWLQIKQIDNELEGQYGLPISSNVRVPVLPDFGAQRPRTCVNNCTHQVRYSIQKTGQFWAWNPIGGRILSPKQAQ